MAKLMKKMGRRLSMYRRIHPVSTVGRMKTNPTLLSPVIHIESMTNQQIELPVSRALVVRLARITLLEIADHRPSLASDRSGRHWISVGTKLPSRGHVQTAFNLLAR